MPVVRNKRNAAEAHAGDIDLVRRALTRDADAFRTIMQTHNRRLYPIARGVVRNDGEARIQPRRPMSVLSPLDKQLG
jgi:RNA polymerase sigma-70 factor (ECF subfamily)